MPFDEMRSRKYIEVIPAYGRDYKSAKEMKSDWVEGLDFIETVTRRYCSKRDFPADRFNVIGRYNKLERVCNLQGK